MDYPRHAPLQPVPPKFRIRTALVVPFVVQILAAVGLVSYLSFQNSQQAVKDLATQLRVEVSDRLTQYLDTYFSTPKQVNKINLKAYQLGILDLSDFRTTRQYFHQQMREFPDMSYVGFGSATEEFVGIGRRDSGELYYQVIDNPRSGNYSEFDLDSNANPTRKVFTVPWNFKSEAWYSKTVKARKAVWSPIYQWADQPEVFSMSFNEPIYQGKTLVGVLSIDLLLTQISDFLNRVQISPNTKLFILERDGRLVARSGTESLYRMVNGKPQRFQGIDSPDARVRAATQYLNTTLNGLSEIQTSQFLSFQYNGERQWVQVIPWKDQLGLDLLIVGVVPESDFMGRVHRNTRNTLILMIGALVVAIALGILTSRWITRPILRITTASEEMADGRLEQSVAPSRIIELDMLAQSFNSMAGQLRQAFTTLEDRVRERTADLANANAEIQNLNQKLKSENLRMGAELDVARQMQQMILPRSDELSAIADLDIAGFMEPADEVGGDYYDVLYTHGIVTISIGDVTGHGLESGILMIMAQTAVRTLQEMREDDPVRFLDILNHTLYQNIQRMNSEKNLTLSILNYVDGKVSISGQHEEAIVVRANGNIERIDTLDLGFPLGMVDDIAEFVNRVSFQLHPGDGVVLYTDGITEAWNLQQQQYGLERLCQIVRQHWQNSAEAIKDAVVADLWTHIGQQRVFDDITLLILKQK